MEDQVITPKSKFDEMERKLKEYSKIIEDEKIKFELTLSVSKKGYESTHTYDKTYNDPFFNFYLNKKVEDLPEGLRARFTDYLETLTLISEAVKEERYAIRNEIVEIEKTISDKKQVLKDIKNAVLSLPKWVLWIAKINVKNYE